MQALKYILGSSGFALIFLGACGERLGLILGLGGSGCLLLTGALAVRELQARRAAAKADKKKAAGRGATRTSGQEKKQPSSL